MQILLLSDSHGDRERARRAILAQPNAEVVFHLGDGVRDIDDLPELTGKTVLRVGGFESLWLAPSLTGTLAGVRYYACHGAAEQVKLTKEILLEKAREFNAAIVLYGHTHEPSIEWVDGVLLMNPGHMRTGEYGVIDISPQGDVTPALLTL